jgi:hypothetical protein
MEDAKWEEIKEYLVNEVFPPNVKGRQKGNWRVKMEKYRLWSALRGTAMVTGIMVLARLSVEGGGKVQRQWRILPKRSELHQILVKFHDEVSHAGRDRMTAAIFAKYWWPDGAKADIESYIKSCPICLQKNGCRLRPQLLPIISRGHRERCQFDLVEFPTDPTTGHRWLLNIINCHSKFVWSFSLKTKTVGVLDDLHSIY